MRTALKAIATSLVRKGMAKNIQVDCLTLSAAVYGSGHLQTNWNGSYCYVQNGCFCQCSAKTMSRQVIGKAKVPIIKFEEVPSNLNFDVSFEVANGPQSAELVRGMVARLPAIRPMLLVLKIFLQQRDMNEARVHCVVMGTCLRSPCSVSCYVPAAGVGSILLCVHASSCI